MSDTNNGGTADATKPETVSKEEFEALQQKFYNREAETVDLKKKLEKFSKIDPDKYHATLEELENLRAEKSKGDPEEYKAWKKQREAELRAEVQKELDAAKDKAGNAEKALRLFKAENAVMQADLLHPEAVGLLREHIDKYTKLDDNGNLIFVDDSGNERYMPGSATEKFTAKAFAQELASKYPFAAKAKGISGDKHENGKSSTSNITPPDFSRMTYQQQVEWFQKNPDFKPQVKL